jgi:glycosyltransferase involved in cell wall biosynthesis
MKIAVLTQYYPSSENPGSGVYVHTRAAAYQAAGHSVRVYRVRPGPATASELEGVRVLAAEAEPVRAEYERFAPDVLAVHTPHPSAAHTRLAAVLPTPRVAWVHGFEAMLTAFRGYHRGLDRALSMLHDARKLWRLRRWLAGADAVIYVSDWMRRAAERSLGFRHSQTEVIANPVDMDRFTPRRAPFTDDKPQGLALRPLRDVQGLDVAVKAYAGLRDTELVIIGTGPEAARLRAEITRRNAPARLEERALPHDQVPALISAFDYFVVPSRSATQCLAMCEAMACGLPVVATRVGGIPEFVRDGQDGFLVRPGRPADLRRAILRLVNEPERAREMGRQARDCVEMKCSAARTVPRELDLLARVRR